MEEEITFEEAMKKLERIVEMLEEGNLPLEESLKIFEEGVMLCRLCNDKLDKAEYKVEKLMEKEGKGSGNEIGIEKFELEE